MEDYVSYFFVLIVLIGLAGLLSNIVVIIVYIFDKKLHSFTNYFFVNLSVCDILIVVLCLPVGLLDMWHDGRWVLGSFVCNVEFFVESVFLCVSSLTLISISLGRFFAIKYPLEVNKFSRKNSTILVLLSVWLLSMVLSSPMFYFTSFGTYNHSGEVIEYCYIERTSFVSKAYVSTFTSLILFAPTLILTFVYVCIIRSLTDINKSYAWLPSMSSLSSSPAASRLTSSSTTYEVVFRSKSATATPDLQEASSLRLALITREKMACEQIKRSYCTKNLIRKRRQTIILCTVAMTFFFCQIPIKAFQIFNSFYEHKDDSNFKTLNILFLTAKLIYCFHSMSNPIIYNLMSSKFSRSYRKVLLCRSLSGSYSNHNNYNNNNNNNFNCCNRKRAATMRYRKPSFGDESNSLNKRTYSVRDCEGKNNNSAYD